MKFYIILLLIIVSMFSCNKEDLLGNDSSQIDSLQVDSSHDTLLIGHPRILLLEGEEEQIKDMYNSEDTWKRMHDAIIAQSDMFLGEDGLEKVLVGFRMLDVSRKAFERIFYLSYSYRMTGESKYLEQADKEIYAVSTFPDWNPQHFLDVGEMTMAVAIGYDWLYDDLSEETREAAKEAIVEKGLRPSEDSNYNGWLNSNTNWNQVCNAGLTFGALAIKEDYPDLADSIIDRAFTKISWLMESYDPDGAYPEGYSYWGYGTTFNVLFLSAVEKALGDDRGLVTSNPAFMKTGDFIKNMITPTVNPFNYSDGGNGVIVNPAMFWFAQKTNTPSVLWSEKQFLEPKNFASITSERYLPAIMIWGKDIKFSDITEPAEKLWKGQGKNPVAFMRSSWSDNNAVFMGFKTGSPNNEHGHMDVGSFVMEANDVRWAKDLGTQDYNSLESLGMHIWDMSQESDRWKVFRLNNFSHNVLTVNNQKQIVDGYAKIDRSSDDDNFMFAISDLSSIYDGQLTKEIRGVGLKNSKYTIVRDEFETLDETTTIRWQMVTSADVQLWDRSASLTDPDAGEILHLLVDGPDNIEMKIWSTNSANINVHDYDSENKGTTIVGFECEIPANTKDFFEVLMVPSGVKASFSGLTLDEW